MMKFVSPNAFRNEEQLVMKEGIPVTDWFVDAFYGNAEIKTLVSILEQLPPGISELMCHPGYVYMEEPPPGMVSSYRRESIRKSVRSRRDY